MTTVERFEDLDVWRNARKLANLVYDLTGDGVFARDFGLRDQIRRAAVSVMSNPSTSLYSAQGRHCRGF